MFNAQSTRPRRRNRSVCLHLAVSHRARPAPAPLEALERRVLLSSWTVNTLNDLVADDGVLSLREAISMSASRDTITFASSLAGGTIVLGGSQLQILNKDLTITGLGANKLTVSGNNASRVFDIEGGNVSVNGLTIANGRAEHGAGIGNYSGTLTLSNCTLSGNTADLDGAGIGNYSGTLTLTNCAFDGNSAAAGTYGAGIYNSSGTATLTNCTFTHNNALSGAGIANSNGATLTLSNCVFDHNSAGNAGGIQNAGTLTATGCTFTNSSVDYGGGIVNYGTATLSDCTFSNNSAENGAGIRNAGNLTLVGCTLSGNFVIDYGGAGIHNTGTATLTNCTLNGNVDGSGHGGAAIRNSSGATLTLNNCTLSGNIVRYGTVGGGGILTDAASTLTLRNTIVSGNSADTGPNDIAGTADPTSSHNLIGIDGGLSNGVNGNIVGVTDPKLAPLADNGGPTQTMALLPDSPALNAGDNSLIPAGISYDQRGPGYPRIVNGTVNIGAYEADASPTLTTQVSLAGAFNRTGIYANGATFSSSGGLDLSGNALSYTLLGSNLNWDSVPFTIGPSGTSNIVHGGSGVTVTLPAGQYASLRLLATAVNGNQPNQSFTLRYTDGTSKTFTQGISDWHTPKSYSGESTAMTMPYRNTASGGQDNRTFELYGYSFTLDPGKTVQSLTLPNNANVEVAAITLVASGPVVMPAAPTDLAAQATSSNQINLSWNASTGAATYNLYRSSTSGGQGTTPYRTGITLTSFSDTSLSPSTTYYYKVAAVNSAGTSPQSTEASATTLASSGTTTPVPLSGSFNQVGIQNNGATFPASASLDGGGYALSATLLGSGIAWNGNSFGIGPAGANDVVRGGPGVAIGLPAGQFQSLQFLAMAVNGNQPNQSFTVRYTDGTSSSFTQSISDWYTSQSYSGESTALTMAYRNTSSGGQDKRTFRLYGYSFTLNPGKTVQSLTLPSNANVKLLAVTLVGTSGPVVTPAAPTNLVAQSTSSSQINLSWNASTGATTYNLYRSSTPGGEGTTPYRTAITGTSFSDTSLSPSTTWYYKVTAVNSAGTSPQSSEASATTLSQSTTTQVALGNSFNRTGIYANGATFSGSGGLDLSGYALSATLLGSNLSWGGVPFTIGPAGANDVAHGGSGMTVNLPGGRYASLRFLATAVNGNQPNQNFTVRYTDGTTTAFTQGISDWYTSQSYSGESTALTMAYRNASSGRQDNRTFRLYGYSFTLDSAKTVQSLTLPNNVNVEVIAITLVAS